ncbi:MAG: protein kinase [Acidobacteriota bacterium]
MNHANIATIHGLEESAGVYFIVMELVEGETLEQRIARSGRIEVTEAVEIARQIAEALEAAHDAGIIHRDLKPANVLLTSRGGVKVLDFGVAKSVAPDEQSAETAQVTSLTMEGTLIGTPPYMSPEQVRGGQVTEKADVWAFGCLLFEMLTGARAFAAETASDTLADVLTKEPDWGALPKATPVRVSNLLRRALRKDPTRRVQHVGDARIELEEAQASVPERPRSIGRLAFAALLVVAAVALGYVGATRDWQGDRGSVEPGQMRSIVVLPLENLMNDPEQSYFVDGMHEALITELSKIDALRVISRTSAMHYRDSAMPVPEIARELGVDAVVEGSVLRAGNVIRVTAQLIEGRTDRHIWADNFDRELDDILALYADVTREIVNQIRVTVTPDEQASLETSRPVNPEVYELYLQGRYLCGNWSPQEMQEGINLLQEAVSLDPQHAGSHAQLALCLVDGAFFEYLRPAQIDSLARAAALTAVRLNDSSAEAHAALGSVSYYLDFDPRAGEARYLRALELNPNSIDTLLRLSWLYAESGRFEEALSPTQRAIELDPLSTAVRNALGQVYYLSRDFDRATRALETALELDRSDPSLHYYLAGPFEQQGQYGRAIALYQSAIDLSERAPLYLAALGHAYGAAGMREEALRVLEELQQTADPSPYHLALVHLGLGNHGQAIDWLERAYEARNMHLLYLNNGPRFDPLRENERFIRLWERFNW